MTLQIGFSILNKGCTNKVYKLISITMPPKAKPRTESSTDKTEEKIERCKTCKAVIKEDDMGMLCDMCEGWDCLRCSGVKVRTYKAMT